MKARTLLPTLRSLATDSRLGRIIVLTGARQTGKTTLVQQGFSDYVYLSLEDPVTRPAFEALSASQWREEYPVAALDEVQKTPRLIESIKATYDAYPEVRYILLGSSRILLLQKGKETLAGRAAMAELFPLTLPEMQSDGWDTDLAESRLVSWLRRGATDSFSGIPQASQSYAQCARLFREYLHFGAMPTMMDGGLNEQEKYDWLEAYTQTYLQRDISDLANLRDFEPFALAQRGLAGLTGQVLNVSELARLSGVAVQTAKRFIHYLELSYQIVLLEPWFRNPGKRLVKSPKVHFLDPGIQRSLLRRRGELSGAEFESAVVAEIYKQLKNSRLPLHFYHLRTADGREVDLLLELEQGFVPIEIKQASQVRAQDARHLRGLSGILDKPVLHALVISNDPQIKELDKRITALPAAWVLGG